MMSEIVSIVYKPENLPDQPSDHYTRVPLASTTLVENYGIEGDRKGGHPKRQLNIMTAEVLAELQNEGFDTAPGRMGEQIIVKGINMNALQEGDQVQLGDAIIEIVSYRNGCDRFKALQSKDPADAKGRLGAMARVVKTGKIAVGDSVKVLQNA
jgi:MOSC domain-containing protein YiiM